MGRYYFNLVGPGRVIPDEEGADLPDDLAEELISAIVEEMRSEEPELFDCDSDWFIEIVDEQGRTLARHLV